MVFRILGFHLWALVVGVILLDSGVQGAQGGEPEPGARVARRGTESREFDLYDQLLQRGIAGIGTRDVGLDALGLERRVRRGRGLILAAVGAFLAKGPQSP